MVFFFFFFFLMTKKNLYQNKNSIKKYCSDKKKMSWIKKYTSQQKKLKQNILLN